MTTTCWQWQTTCPACHGRGTTSPNPRLRGCPECEADDCPACFGTGVHHCDRCHAAESVILLDGELVCGACADAADALAERAAEIEARR